MSATRERVGPYRLVEVLGAGGMGVVYRGEHEGTGQLAAVKTVRVPRQGFLRGIRREIHALARLRHPGIVPILDEGVEDGLPWYAMELVQGVTLKSHAELARSGSSPGAETASIAAAAGPLHRPSGAGPGSWWTSSLEPAPPEARAGAPAPAGAWAPGGAAPGEMARDVLFGLLGVVRRLCETLAFLHGEGIVHRDLKPENVLVRHDGTPVLMDFGLASRFGGELSREDLESDSPLVGTVAYMAPEQARRQIVDARADLYSLGCLLYELIAGAPPFTGKTPRDVLRQHLEAVPQPPSQRATDVQPELDALVLGLLAKQPQQRLGHASDVASVLAGMGVTAGFGPGAPPPRSYLYRPRFAGREAVLERLLGEVDRAYDGDGGVLLVGGESGIGKTRLVVELVQQLQGSPATVLTGECQPALTQPGSRGSGAVAGALHALRRPLQQIVDRCRERGEDETERLLGPRASVLALYEPAIRTLPGLEGLPGPAELPPAEARLRLFRYLTLTLEALGEGSVLLLALDDLQWADELTLEMLRYFMRNAAGRAQVLVVGTYRSEEKHEALEAVLAAPECRRVDLERLGEQAVAALCGDMLAMLPPPPAFARFLSGQSGGNPFFVAEYLRAAVGQGLLYRNEAGRWQLAAQIDADSPEAAFRALPLPSSLVDLVVGRLEALSAAARRLAEIAAVFGREIEEGLLFELGALAGDEALEALSELLQRQMLEEASTRGRASSIRFVHDKLREGVLARIEPQRRLGLHRAVAEALEALPEDERPAVAAELGQHWQQAGEPEKAWRWYLVAARRAKGRSALAEAEKLFRLALALPRPPGPERVRVRNELGFEVLDRSGRSGDGLIEHEAALAEAREVHDSAGEAEALRCISGFHSDRGALIEAETVLQSSLAVAASCGDRTAEALALNNLARVASLQGSFDKAEEYNVQALSIHRECGDRRREAESLTNLAMARSSQGDVSGAMSLAEQALAIHREMGNRTFEGVTLTNLATYFYRRGEFPRSRLLLEQGLVIHRETGNRYFEAMTLGNLSSVAEDLQLRADLLEQVLPIHNEMGNHRLEAWARCSLGSVRLEQGRLADARELFEGGLALLERVGDVVLEAQKRCEWARIERLTARSGTKAARLVQAAEKLFRARGAVLELVSCLCERGRILLADGRSARKQVEEAQALTEQVGVGPGSTTAKDVAKLRAVQEAFDAGEHERLFRGELLTELSDELRHALLESHPPRKPRRRKKT
jgi:serine/threonine protein kinase/tetratricopeptide (TPR) repeat protein